MMQVLTNRTGFGRVGALLSSHFHQIYEVAASGRTCGKFEYDRLQQIAAHAAGLR